MSLEKIDAYMKQLKAIKNYDRVCEKLDKIGKEFAERGQTIYCLESIVNSLILSMNEIQKERREREERIKLCHAIMDMQQEYISLLEIFLKKAQQEISGLKTTAGNQSHYTSKKSCRFNDFFSLDITIDDPKTILKRKMNAIYYWLLTNGLLSL